MNLFLTMILMIFGLWKIIILFLNFYLPQINERKLLLFYYCCNRHHVCGFFLETSFFFCTLDFCSRANRFLRNQSFWKTPSWLMIFRTLHFAELFCFVFLLCPFCCSFVDIVFCVHRLFARLDLQEKQQVNGRQTQSSAGLNLPSRTLYMCP